MVAGWYYDPQQQGWMVEWMDGGVQTRQYCIRWVDLNLHPMGGGGIVEPQRTKIVCILCRDTV